MIAALTGIVRGSDERSVFFDVHGVTFRLFVVPRAESFFHVGDQLTVQTYLHVREDSMDLFGFVDARERRLFERLISVSGVGPRLALAVMSAGHVADLEAAIDRGDASLLTKVSGVGTKTAQRIVVDLRGKLLMDSEEDTTLAAVIDALTGLGYSAKEARTAAMATPSMETAEQRLRLALKSLGRKRS